MKIENLKIFKKVSAMTVAVVIAGSLSSAPVVPVVPEKTVEPTVSEVRTLPQTGDPNDMTLPLTGLIVSSTALIGLGLAKRKRLIKK